MYHEQQQWARCGMHALNALARRPAYTTAALDHLADQLAELNTQAGNRTWLHPHRTLWFGNYDVNVMEAALSQRGMALHWLPTSNDPELLSVPALIQASRTGEQSATDTLRPAAEEEAMQDASACPGNKGVKAVDIAHDTAQACSSSAPGHCMDATQTTVKQGQGGTDGTQTRSNQGPGSTVSDTAEAHLSQGLSSAVPDHYLPAAVLNLVQQLRLQQARLVGFLCNTEPIVKSLWWRVGFRGRHWIAVMPQANGVDDWYDMDSMHLQPRLLGGAASVQDFLCQHVKTHGALLLVVLQPRRTTQEPSTQALHE